jgi:hypothetical protein
LNGIGEKLAVTFGGAEVKCPPAMVDSVFGTVRIDGHSAHRVLDAVRGGIGVVVADKLRVAPRILLSRCHTRISLLLLVRRDCF